MFRLICSLEIDLTASKISQKMLPAVSHEEIRRWQSRTIRSGGCAKPSERFEKPETPNSVSDPDLLRMTFEGGQYYI